MKKQIELNAEKERVTNRLVPLCLLSLLTVMVWAGCKHEKPIAGNSKGAAAANVSIDPVGAYVLESVDGQNVPCRIQHQGHGMTINTGSFEINADGTCRSSISLANRQDAIQRKAAYTQQGPKLTMKWQRAGSTIGTLDGDKFTMNNEGMVFAYRKDK